MSETTNKYKRPVCFSKAKLAWYPFTTIYFLTVLNILQIYPNLLKFTYKFDPKFQRPENLSENCNACDIFNVSKNIHNLRSWRWSRECW